MYKVAQDGLNVLSRILQYSIGNLNVIIGSPNYNNCQKPYTYFNLENQST